MLLLHIPIVASFLVTGLPFTTAHLLSTNSPATPTILQTESPATQTLVYRQASPTPTLPPTITGEYFMTTKYITIDGFTNDHATKHPETITLALPTCHQTIPPDNNGYLPPGTCGAMYNYYPSFAAAIVAAVVFGALTIAHTGLAAVYKKRFCWVIIMGSLWETIAFATRAVSTRQQQNSSLVLVSQLFVLLVPLWINAYIYILLSRLIHFFHPTHSVLSIPAPLLSLMFVLLDFTTFVIQMVGGSIAGPTAPLEEQMRGIHIYMGGIALQEFFIVLFVGVAARFQWEMGRVERMRVGDGKGKGEWKRLLWSVYAGLGFITIRILYRLIEFSRGKDKESNPLPFKEVYLYVLEVAPMFFAVGTFVLLHPGRVLVGPGSEMPGVWQTLMGGERKAMKGRWWRGKDRKVVDGDEEELVGRYEMVDGWAHKVVS